jgi:hypothetical protein
LITCEDFAAQQAGESFAFVSTINDITGRPTKKESDFAQEKWGHMIKGYVVNIANKLVNHPVKFDELIIKTKQYGGLKEHDDSLTAKDKAMNEHAFLMDDSDSDD